MKLRSFKVKMGFFPFFSVRLPFLNAVTFKVKLKLEMHTGRLHCKPKIQLQKTLQYTIKTTIPFFTLFSFFSL